MAVMENIDAFSLTLTVIVCAMIAFAIGFAISYILKICKQKKHYLLYLAVVLSLINIGYFFFIDEETQVTRTYLPRVYYGFLMLMGSYLLLYYFIYKWSKLSYALIIVIMLFAGILYGIEFNAASELLAEQGASLETVTDFSSSLLAMGISGAFTDFIKFGLLLGAKYKFLK